MLNQDIDVLLLLELLGCPDNQFFPVLDYIADVVGCFSCSVGNVPELLEQDDLKIRIDTFGLGGCTGASGRTADNNEFFRAPHPSPLFHLVTHPLFASPFESRSRM